jgi:thymidylate synthase (FAD)
MPEECYVPKLERIQEQSTDNKQGSGDSVQESVATCVQHFMQNQQKVAFEYYHDYLSDEMRVSREIARINLPLSTYTEWYWLMDLHNLFHFLKLRMDQHAQWEIRQYANAIFELIKPVIPVSCEAFEDYVLNAVTFSAQEMVHIIEIRKALDRYATHIGPRAWIDYDSQIDGAEMSKRELEEFKRKLGL